MLEQLSNLDTDIFLFINRDLANKVFDLLLPPARNAYTWIPLYLFVIYLLFKKYGWKNALLSVAVIALVIVLGDSVIADSAKFYFKSVRPCHDCHIKNQVILRVASCGGQYGYFSAHATNHFAMAVLFSNLITNKKYIHWLFYFWAFTIAFAQVYVGKHYPGDVLTGAIVGLILGYSGWILIKKIIIKKRL